MEEQRGGWRKVGTHGKCRSIFDAEGNLLRSEYRKIVRREPSTTRLAVSTANVSLKRIPPQLPQPVLLAGGCTLYQLPGTARLRRQPARA